MKKNHILHPELNRMLASMGHGDILMVTDAGFPIPRDAWCVDLALIQDLPDVMQVLQAIMQDFCIEKITYAEELKNFNPGLHGELMQLFADLPHEHVSHDSLMENHRHKVKGFVRSGGFNAWGNIMLHSLPDVPKWFEKEGTLVPPWYEEAAGK
jgi:D-ribose pyranose/furanose isomerase RbsD